MTDTPTIEEEGDSGPPANLVKKKEIYDHVTIATGLRRREVREAVDATFAFLFECLSDGKDAQCPPLGKLRSITKGEGDDAKTIYKLMLQKPGSGKSNKEEEVAEVVD
ncbi:MAG: hypothetical protein GY952_05515 [Rhodobacteraceae bacterium]|nr:hypothetical protein [Paracoccaceae bacterium]